MPYFNTYKPEDEGLQTLGSAGGAQPLSRNLTEGFSTPQTNMYTPPQHGNSSGRTPGGSPDDTTTPYTPSEASGSDFVNFSQYVNANKGASEQNAKGITNDTRNAADDASRGMGSLLNDFRGQVAGAAPGYAGYTVNQGVGQNASTFSQAQNGTTSNTIPTSIPPQTTGGKGAGGGPGIQAAEQLTRAEVEKRANTGYTGPTSLAQQPGYDAATGKVRDAQSQIAALQSKDGLSGYLAKQFGGSQAGYASPESGARELDSLLIGNAGKKQFERLKGQSALLDNDMAMNQSLADQSVNEGKANSQIIQDKYKQLLGNYDSAEGARGKENERVAKEAQEKEQAKKDREARAAGYDDYNAWRHESLVRNVTNYMDPTWYLKQLGVTKFSVNDKLTDMWEGQVANKMGIGNDSDHVNTGNLTPDVAAKWKDVYSDLSDDELAQVEDMSIGDQMAFINKRHAEMVRDGKVSGGA